MEREPKGVRFEMVWRALLVIIFPIPFARESSSSNKQFMAVFRLVYAEA